MFFLFKKKFSQKLKEKKGCTICAQLCSFCRFVYCHRHVGFLQFNQQHFTVVRISTLKITEMYVPPTVTVRPGTVKPLVFIDKGLERHVFFVCVGIIEQLHLALRKHFYNNAHHCGLNVARLRRVLHS